MKNIFKTKNLLPIINFLITMIFFVSVEKLSEINSFSGLIVALLEFIIILEIVRMIIEFMFSDQNRIRLRLMIDSTIVFFIRDIMLIANDTFNSEKIFTVLGIIAILLFFRIVASKFSPSKIETSYYKKEAV